MSENETVETETIEPEIKKEEDLKCTCNDEFATTFCPVHPPDFIEKEKAGYGENDALVVTDADMIGYGQWEGYIFTCPECGVNAVMVNPTMGKTCSNCGRKIVVKSKTITAKIRSLSKR